jgi:hypothetical protein
MARIMRLAPYNPVTDGRTLIMRLTRDDQPGDRKS